MFKSSTLRVWTDINTLLRTHKLINFGLIILCVLQTITIFTFYFSEPIVVLKSEKGDSYLSGQRRSLPISEDVVEGFVKEFLTIRYQWESLDPKLMSTNLAPIVTEGLKEKIFSILTQLNEKEFQGKNTSQSIVNVKVSVTKDKVIASFDKLLRIEGIPIPVPTTVSLNIIKDSPNKWNPVGLLVNGIIEHQTK